MRIASTVSDSIVDGPGLRFTVFTQGCPHRCPGCHNPGTHDPAGGREADRRGGATATPNRAPGCARGACGRAQAAAHSEESRAQPCARDTKASGFDAREPCRVHHMLLSASASNDSMCLRNAEHMFCPLSARTCRARLYVSIGSRVDAVAMWALSHLRRAVSPGSLVPDCIYC